MPPESPPKSSPNPELPPESSPNPELPPEYRPNESPHQPFFLLVAVSNVMVAVRAKLAAMSCWRTAVLFIAARARLLRAVLRCLIAGAAAGITP